jgi:hypothetical protein
LLGLRPPRAGEEAEDNNRDHRDSILHVPTLFSARVRAVVVVLKGLPDIAG